jgi:hypothetical protein
MNTRERVSIFSFWLLAAAKSRTQMNADFADETQILQKIEDELFKKIGNDPFICVRVPFGRCEICVHLRPPLMYTGTGPAASLRSDDV